MKKSFSGKFFRKPPAVCPKGAILPEAPRTAQDQAVAAFLGLQSGSRQSSRAAAVR